MAKNGRSKSSSKVPAVTASGPTELEPPEEKVERPAPEVQAVERVPVPGVESTPPTPHPQEPTPEEQARAWVQSTDERLGLLEKKLERTEVLLVKVDEGLSKIGVYGEERRTNAGPGSKGGDEGFLGILREIRGAAKDLGFVGGGGDTSLDSLKMQIGDRVINGSIDTLVRRVTKEIGTETASHVTLRE